MSNLCTESPLGPRTFPWSNVPCQPTWEPVEHPVARIDPPTSVRTPGRGAPHRRRRQPLRSLHDTGPAGANTGGDNARPSCLTPFGARQFHISRRPQGDALGWAVAAPFGAVAGGISAQHAAGEDQGFEDRTNTQGPVRGWT